MNRNMRLLHTSKVILNVFAFILLTLFSQTDAVATVKGFSIDNSCGLPRNAASGVHHVYQGACVVNLSSTFYVPMSAWYTVGVWGAIHDGSTFFTCWANKISYIDSTKSLNSQNVDPGVNASWLCVWSLHSDATYDVCDVLKGPDGKVYYLNTIGKCTGEVLPPTPVINTSCTINNGNALSVSLGTLDRATLPTTPDSGTAQHSVIPVSCTGGDVTVSMKITYTAITIGSTQAVKTSANGVGTAIIYDNAAISPTSTVTLNLKNGTSNSVDLGFQAIRDSTVAVKDIPTGAFTASAVMVMTQQ